MILDAGLLIAAICPFAFELVHFSMQHTLKDRRTILFLILIICGFINAISGVLIGFVTKDLFIKQILLECIYISEFSFPYLMLEFLSLNCRKLNSKFLKWIRFIETICIIFVLLNPFHHQISYIDDKGIIHIAQFYPFFVWCMIVMYLMNIGFTLTQFNSMRNQQYVSFIEASCLMILSIIFQNLLHIRLVNGYMASIVIGILYFATQNQYAYIEFTTRIFNVDYFNYWLWEQIQFSKKVHIIGISFTNMEKLRMKFDLDRELHQYISDNLWDIAPKHKAFRIRTNKYAICTSTKEEHEQLLKTLENLFNHEISIQGKSIRFSVVLADILDVQDKFNSSEEVMNYMSVLLRKKKNPLNVQVVHDNESSQTFYKNIKEIEQYMSKAMTEDLFEVYYQPIYSTKERKFVSVETLSRLYHPTLGWINPELFIDIATKDGQIYDLMPMQLHKICRFVRKCQACSIKINLTPSEIVKEGYIKKLLEIINSYELDYKLFEFEVTESAATEYSSELMHCIKILQEKGIKLCLDDFGSGYANLNGVLSLPFSIIKMDRSLLQDITVNEVRATFYYSMIKTLHALNYKIVAEGVETKEEADLLTKWGIDYIQGYYYSKPLNEKECIDLLKAV